MDSNALLTSMFFRMGIGVSLMVPVWIAFRLRGQFGGKSDLNKTDDWTPGPNDHPKTPTLTPLTPYDLKLITAYLGSGEALEGFTRGFFVPQRARDWKPDSGLTKLALLVAATSRRLLLFEVRGLEVLDTCFVPYEEIEFLDPPKPGIFGTSGQMKVRLRSGREYQFRFLGPLFNPEAMRQEQHMAAYFRRVAVRIGTGSGNGVPITRSAA